MDLQLGLDRPAARFAHKVARSRHKPVVQIASINDPASKHLHLQKWPTATTGMYEHPLTKICGLDVSVAHIGASIASSCEYPFLTRHSLV